MREREEAETENQGQRQRPSQERQTERERQRETRTDTDRRRQTKTDGTDGKRRRQRQRGALCLSTIWWCLKVPRLLFPSSYSDRIRLINYNCHVKPTIVIIQRTSKNPPLETVQLSSGLHGNPKAKPSSGLHGNPKPKPSSGLHGNPKPKLSSCARGQTQADIQQEPDFRSRSVDETRFRLLIEQVKDSIKNKI